MKTQTLIIGMALTVALSLAACKSARDINDEMCQMQHDCMVQNCRGDAESDCKVNVEVTLKDCRELAEVSENARKHLPNKCSDLLEERIACMHDSFKCHQREQRVANETVTVYSVIYGGECDYIGDYIEERCTHNKYDVIYIKDDNNNP